MKRQPDNPIIDAIGICFLVFLLAFGTSLIIWFLLLKLDIYLHIKYCFFFSGILTLIAALSPDDALDILSALWKILHRLVP